MRALPPPRNGPGRAARLSSRRSLIKQLYEVDPLACLRCGGSLRILAFIDQPQIVAKILIHLALWPASAHSPPVAGSPVPSSLQRVAAA